MPPTVGEADVLGARFVADLEHSPPFAVRASQVRVAITATAPVGDVYRFVASRKTHDLIVAWATRKTDQFSTLRKYGEPWGTRSATRVQRSLKCGLLFRCDQPRTIIAFNRFGIRLAIFWPYVLANATTKPDLVFDEIGMPRDIAYLDALARRTRGDACSPF